MRAMLTFDGRRGRTATLALAATVALSGLTWAGGDDGLTPLPPAPVAVWEFLDASSQIEHPAPHSDFRAASEGDLDNDGDLDVVIGQNHTSAGVFGTSAPSVLYINENGRFMDRTAQYLPELLAPQVTWWTNIHDFDSPPDGWADIFVPGGNGEPSRLYKNRGRDPNTNAFLGFQDVSFRITGPLSASTFSYHAHKGDFDGDGAMDMFVYQYRSDLGLQQGQNRLLMNRGGILTDETATRLPIRSEPGIFGHCEDLNGDGKIDISQVNLKNGLVPGVPPNVPSIRVLINDGTGHFPTSLEQVMPERINPGSGLGTYSLEQADLNGDGWLDIYVINWGMPGNDARDAVLVSSRNPSQLFPAANIYYPEFPISGRDDDGDHPVARDLNGDGKVDVVVAQFATRPFVLQNETANGVLRLVERTPAEVLAAGESGFRTKLFDANGDGKADIWLALRSRNYLIMTPAAEVEPNDSIAGANATPGFPALRVGGIAGPRTLDSSRDGAGDTDLRRDLDYFRVPQRAITEGARIRLKPAPDTDLKLTVLDATGLVVAISDTAGMGGMEQIVLTPASAAYAVQVDRQAAEGAGTYRLDFTTVTGLQRPPAPAPEKLGSRRRY